ncbi:hypothetical protein AUJ66_00775 [Candidatus Desantisbacteria bacterium CG1_02_38_46]|uniref:TonB C-terminal domain-containing protein n=3 Tax=unclassified Candidatus Desantisiibacteriota TaxID=3106372 RepID=A0A2H9P9I2_9BACT|nr:MAG: hypothetical protein AUJ66_00775 [Candidatus Desantisbacteria bacterium CG1_02_38_46]PIU51727.1 MAG: hypothetical protein COS91_02955 [Candidatus Desantisbacteria bacterium CG07_land_8_20_14_0_80_39_15]PIZ14870.1 MAG: hypothetical protein COY51_07125 [Candidatus Desantisbacteria bacterium CG_4_10_14_0_8_um_filter_39_17]
MVIKNRFNYFLSVSFITHLLILFLLSLFTAKVRRKEIPLIEVSLIKIEVGGGPVAGKGIAERPKMLSGISYPFKIEDARPSAISFRREYAEPTWTPISAVPSRRGDVSIVGVKKEETLKALALTGSLKRGPDFPSGAESVSGVSGGRLGIAGPVATRGILYFECPVYPEWAEKKGIESRVKLKFWVSPDGDVDEVLVEQKGYLQLDNLAVQSLKKWRFEPLPSGVKQARQWGTIEMIFKLQ